eukprot:CAMPEP_0196573014 /NCGR_PEP_ID=MMETSP1081-20130531/2987_1 /TAXON_ID=36882 /ORGANISM="Pyramimonas amylifera, Strain CCMP720" /LENGTH=153 /DNA_ID=CAMNT_0041890565 /DNA_START=241 /DNA_END=702 /DNA_ORIENTATION=-
MFFGPGTPKARAPLETAPVQTAPETKWYSTQFIKNTGNQHFASFANIPGSLTQMIARSAEKTREHSSPSNAIACMSATDGYMACKKKHMHTKMDGKSRVRKYCAQALQDLKECRDKFGLEKAPLAKQSDSTGLEGVVFIPGQGTANKDRIRYS